MRNTLNRVKRFFTSGSKPDPEREARLAAYDAVWNNPGTPVDFYANKPKTTTTGDFLPVNSDQEIPTDLPVPTGVEKPTPREGENLLGQKLKPTNVEHTITRPALKTEAPEISPEEKMQKVLDSIIINIDDKGPIKIVDFMDQLRSEFPESKLVTLENLFKHIKERIKDGSIKELEDGLIPDDERPAYSSLLTFISQAKSTLAIERKRKEISIS